MVVSAHGFGNRSFDETIHGFAKPESVFLHFLVVADLHVERNALQLLFVIVIQILFSIYHGGGPFKAFFTVYHSMYCCAHNKSVAYITARWYNGVAYTTKAI